MKRPLLFLCVSVICFIALLTHAGGIPKDRAAAMEYLAGRNVVFSAKVTGKEKKNSDNLTRWKMELSSLSILSVQDNRPDQNSQKKLQYLNKALETQHFLWEPEEAVALEIHLGDVLTLEGKLQGFEKAGNPGEFDAYFYYTAQGFAEKLTEAKILSQVRKYSMKNLLYRWRERASYNLQCTFPGENASVLQKMLLGDDSNLKKETKELYKEGGILHILAISGLHITLLGMGVYVFLGKLGIPKGVCAMVGMIFLLFYGELTGFGISVCRAIGMYVVKMFGEILHKQYDSLTAMGVLAFLLVVYNPMQLRQGGFWLSFGAVAGLGMIYPLIKQEKNKGIRKIKDMLFVSFSVTMMTLPIQFYFFYQFQVYSAFINIPVLLLMTVLIVVGILAIFIPGNPISFYIGNGILYFYEKLCRLSLKLPGNIYISGRPKGWQIGTYYVLLFLFLYFLKRKKKQMVHKLPMTLLTFGVLFLVIHKPANWGFSIHMADVGQGDFIYVDTGKGQHYIFDCGSSSRKKLAENLVIPYLHYYGVNSIDGIFLSHGDQDHISGIEELMEVNSDIRIRCIYIPDIVDLSSFERIMELAEKRKIPVQRIARGDGMQWDQLTLTCLYPYRGSKETDNEASACFLWEVEKVCFLLTGDLEGNGETVISKDLYGKNLLALKVAHHGSKYSTKEEFLNAVKPQIALISAGKKNSYGHPHEETIERLEKGKTEIYTTILHGEVIIRIWGKNVGIKTKY